MDGANTATRGIRGATTVAADEADLVRAAVAELLAEIRRANGARPEDLAALIFTVTEDLPLANPAAAAREEGWDDVPLLVTREHAGDAGVPRCLRVLALWNTPSPQRDVRHIYLRGAARLRPDLAN